ncbi:glutamyl-tRNA(Gln) and/or aspartyl-tRNA(Asn) amidotransferase, C subunit [Desulfitobacterium dehalogenans ATCC 51507]|uniref:Aspartyl/glutamyl-tRNA(Asn/Gln) amidotransferase subunit C n=1 Tax=Desulfitobacterium dehalogenans (strain ATCC 51507 / DSM 9161 / JW/IU-DC1) TaxID=756499 RepID=I4AE41_DESDJ|nr:Asp-tRNA(Asn)/Glu-tRNA(Gln) amidotransferase subunit GatC [Desulfitobacterium dehalogenans]AFM02226.1 glutamyl-tRNA(Gln) and/or aspartyl-tRNA(Asn) amidotransferase, C subunit [Desulfitobacterium dehalogenans ATCC 51507]
MKITEKDVEQLALTSRLELTAEEITAYTKSLHESLDYMEVLKQCDTGAIDPAALVLPIINVFREDKVQAGMDKELVFANAPEEEDGAFKVPRIL